ncbi:MAG TPA: hypothetical protein VLW50_12285 [Streptosporangiaceae bacterium]|nr:hypothetical protein [Streptosporangiaceae bacterium]
MSGDGGDGAGRRGGAQAAGPGPAYLERAGFTVLSTGSGAEAITMAAAAAPGGDGRGCHAPALPW